MICAARVDKMGKACGTYGRELYSGFWWEKQKKKRKRETTWDICIRWDGNIIELEEINVGRCDVD